jgi:hypothetical protein
MIRGIVKISRHNNHRNISSGKDLSLCLFFFLFLALCPLPFANAQTSSYHVNVDSLITQLKAQNATTYTWKISNPNDWVDLSTFLPKAKINGITVTILLLPPSECPPINPTGNYSEPYRLDFIAWAKVIAKLSLRYSNFNSYSIENFQENVNHGYFSQTYIDSVNLAGLTINPKLKFLNSGKFHFTFYVSIVSSGDSSASSWANAKALYLFDRSKVNGGDTVYIDGGSNSLVYKGIYSHTDLNYNYVLYWDRSGSSGNKIILTKGKDPGHNGTPIFRGDTTNTYAIYASGISYVEFSYLQVDTSFGGGLYLWHGFEQGAITLDNGANYVDILFCNIYYPLSAGIWIYRPNHIKIMHNTISTENISNAFSSDGIYMSGIDDGADYGNIVIAHNYFSFLNSWNGTSPDPPHTDEIQLFGIGLRGSTNLIYDNIFYVNSNSTPRYGSGLTNIQSLRGTWNIYNNVFYWGSTTTHSFCQFGGYPNANNPTKLTINLFNNTFISPPYSYIEFDGGIDSLRFENNLIKRNGSANYFFIADSAMLSQTWVKMDYNHFGLDTSKIFRNTTTSKTYGWSGFQNIFPQNHSNFGTVTFLNEGSPNIIDYTCTNLANTGTNLSLYFTDDILGTIRPQTSVWDVGAVQGQ